VCPKTEREASGEPAQPLHERDITELITACREGATTDGTPQTPQSGDDRWAGRSALPELPLEVVERISVELPARGEKVIGCLPTAVVLIKNGAS
jgi:hypothetical protein